jgi:hypothetical protein
VHHFRNPGAFRQGDVFALHLRWRRGEKFRNAFRTIQNAFVIAPAIGRQIIAYDQ